jgi:DNA-directed RNA polymerase III subunit RPC4
MRLSPIPQEMLDGRSDRLYLFQLPAPFPTFVDPTAPKADPAAPKAEAGTAPKAEDGARRVAFADDADAKPEPARAVLDGVIGELEIRRSGAATMRLGEGALVLEVVAGTQPAFVQHAVALDARARRLVVLGTVGKRFVCSPDVDALLAALDAPAPAPVDALDGENLYTMDVDAQ